MKRYCQKLALNLGVIGFEVAFIWVAYNLFARNWLPLVAAISFFIILGSLIALFKVVRSRRFRWQCPSILKTTIAVIMVVVISTFAGIEPMSSQKDRIFTSITSTLEKWEEAQVVTEEEPAPESIPGSAPIPIPVPPSILEPVIPQPYVPPRFPSTLEPIIPQPLPETVQVVEPEPQGIYRSSPVVGITLTFENNRLALSSLWGRHICQYEIIDSETILLIDVVTGKREIIEYKYVAEEDCVVFDGTMFWGENTTLGEKSVQGDEKETFDLINKERLGVGLPTISWDDNLYRGARDWSGQMAEEGNLYHDMSGSFAECIYGASWSGYRTPEQTVRAWMESSGHRSILLGWYSIGAVGVNSEKGFFATYRCQ